jgi:hypothetical protein
MKPTSAIIAVLALSLGTLAAAPKEENKEPEKKEPEKKTPAKAAPDVTKPETLVGLPHKEAKDLADKAKIPNRVIKRDGKDLPSTMDFVENRLNFTVEKDIVTAVTKAP